MQMNNINTKDIFEVFRVILVMTVMILLLLLAGCKPNNTTNYYQSNYGEQCLYPPHTDSYKNLLFCYQENLSKEHAQNKISNN